MKINESNITHAYIYTLPFSLSFLTGKNTSKDYKDHRWPKTVFYLLTTSYVWDRPNMSQNIEFINKFLNIFSFSFRESDFRMRLVISATYYHRLFLD